MTRTIYIPDGEAGDEAAKRIIPALWKTAQGASRRATPGVEGE